MKNARLAPLVALLLCSVFLGGCASVQPGNDPVIVHAQQTIAIGTDAFDTFLAMEESTHQTFCAVSPEACGPVHKFGENLRRKVADVGPDGTPRTTRQAKKWLNTATHLTDVYIATPSPENKANLQKILNVITAAVAESQRYMLKLKAVRGP